MSPMKPIKKPENIIIESISQSHYNLKHAALEDFVAVSKRAHLTGSTKKVKTSWTKIQIQLTS